MKKIYNSPSTIVVAVKTQKHMLFGSPDGDTLNGGGNKGNYNSSSMEQASRKSSSWDDEDE